MLAHWHMNYTVVSFGSVVYNWECGPLRTEKSDGSAKPYFGEQATNQLEDYF